MNFAIICRTLSNILLILSALMLLPLAVGLIYGENILNFAITIALTAGIGFVLSLAKPVSRSLFAREGFIIVGLAWILISALGALPFVISGSIPNYIDAFFETVPALPPQAPQLLAMWSCCPELSCSGAASPTGWAAWVCWSLPLPFCR